MRKIALITDGWKRFFTYAWPAGILQRIQETGEAINLYIFNSSGNWSRDKEYNIGEYNIYNLPNLKEFDGIILELNNISSLEVLNNVVRRARESGKPVLSISNELDEFYYVGINNYAAMKECIAHLHEVHGCKSFWFLIGPKTNYESECRRRALKDYMNEHALPFSKEDFYYGEFDYHSGVKGYRKLKAQHTEKPDAIICVNDNVAVAVCEMAAADGYSVPEDFCVTGFDNFDKAEYYTPSITSVSYIREEISYLCADILLKLWNGEQVPRYNYIRTDFICRESCGCEKDTVKNVREHLKGQILYGIQSGKFDEEVLALESEMAQCNTVEEMMYCIPQCFPSLKCDAMYLILDDNINAYKTELEKLNRDFRYAEDGFLHEGYPEKMQVRFAYEKDRMLDLSHTEIEGIFPMFDTREGGKDFLFLPIHFSEHTVGYFVIQNAVYLMEQQYLFQITNALTTAMENLHKKEKLEYMNHKLSTLYMVDQLTGMYNRMGYQKLGENYFRIMHENKRKMIIFFIDLDRLKHINDNFGHEYGDFAICATARVIMKCSDKDAVPSRTGGDEFILIQSYISDEQAREMVVRMRKELDAEARKMNLPFDLSISVGNIVTNPESNKNLAEYVKMADHKMYDEKMKKKVNR